MKFVFLKDGQWIDLEKYSKILFVCCDCHLVHNVKVKEKANHLEIMIESDKKATEKMRIQANTLLERHSKRGKS